ncbi:MAG: carboxypeptidase regulatory-like domain-containing protein [Proteobacteria bacterium]|nr:carboxypeptidase regulatory-like domain-containing protein [Pseudomonadota bacterium]
MRFLILPFFLFAGCSEYDIGGTPHTEVPGLNGAVRGQICDASGDAWLNDALVWVEVDLDGDGAFDGTIDTKTDEEGLFLLEGVPMGEQVITVEKGRFHTTIDVNIDTTDVIELATPACIEQKEVTLAVITGDYDSIQNVLTAMGLEYDQYKGRGNNDEYITNLLAKPNKMAEYDIIFFNCGINEIWHDDREQIASNIREYVKDGGSIYTSDWAHGFFEYAYPNAADFWGNDNNPADARVGAKGQVQGKILDKPMKKALGQSKAKLVYDLDSWVVVSEVASDTEILVEGKAVIEDWANNDFTELNDAPLAIRIKKGEGTALYTTFHNEQQISLDMAILLEEIVYSL